jgi:hypothetical protein
MMTPLQGGRESGAPSVPWWKTVSLLDLNDSAALVKRFVERGTDEANPAAVETEAFARAVALQAHFANDAAVEDVLHVVNTRLDAMSQALTRPDSTRELETMCTWLSMATCIAKGLERSVELLPAAIAGSARTGVKRLTGRIRELNTQCVVHGLEHGIGRPLVAPDRAVFDRLKPRKSGGTPPKR